MGERPLTPKQQAFVREYLVDLNAAAAYRRAGYTAKNDHVAAASAAKLLTNADISAAVAEAQKSRAERLELTQDYVLKGLRAEAEDHGKGSSHAARVSAYKLLGQHLGMFKERVEYSGGVQVEHSWDYSKLTDDELHKLIALFRSARGEPGGGTGADAGGGGPPQLVGVRPSGVADH